MTRGDIVSAEGENVADEGLIRQIYDSRFKELENVLLDEKLCMKYYGYIRCTCKKSGNEKFRSQQST